MNTLKTRDERLQKYSVIKPQSDQSAPQAYTGTCTLPYTYVIDLTWKLLTFYC